MSIRVMNLVDRHSTNKGAALFLLDRMADHAHDDGRGIRPSRHRLARRLRIGVRTVDALIVKLLASGELVLEHKGGGGGKGDTTHYRIDLALLASQPNVVDLPVDNLWRPKPMGADSALIRKPMSAESAPIQPPMSAAAAALKPCMVMVQREKEDAPFDLLSGQPVDISEGMALRASALSEMLIGFLDGGRWRVAVMASTIAPDNGRSWLAGQLAELRAPGIRNGPGLFVFRVRKAFADWARPSTGELSEKALDAVAERLGELLADKLATLATLEDEQR